MIPFLQARNYTSVPRGRQIDYIVIHTMESPEKPNTAEAVAQWFHGSTAPQVSAHYCLDSDSIVQCVALRDVAWCAPGVNHNGIHFEHAGYASQSGRQWQDVYSQEMLRRSAELASYLCQRFEIPVKFIDADGLRAGRRGITTHAAASLAFGGSDHWDPGPNFPMNQYLSLIRLANIEKPDPEGKPWPIPVPTWFWAWAEWRLSGRAKGEPRPASASAIIAKDGRIPDWAWRRLDALIAGRKKGS